MQFGCCVGGGQLFGQSSLQDEKAFVERLQWFANLGFDFLELGFSWVASLDEDSYEKLVKAFKTAKMPVWACNLFIPRDLPIIGPQRDLNALRAYMSKAFPRVKALGCKYVVFGSGGARSFPEGYPVLKAWQDMKEFCKVAAEDAKKSGITIVLEPLRYQESDIINTVSTGYAFADAIGHPNFQLLADSYHMEETGEPVEVLKYTYPAINHVHTADTERVPPGLGSYDHAKLLSTLRDLGYNQGVSIECKWQNFDAQVPGAITHLKQTWQSL
jgi:sugar phosphate isomerase/epimerase